VYKVRISRLKLPWKRISISNRIWRRELRARGN